MAAGGLPMDQVKRGVYTAKKLMSALGLTVTQAAGLVGCFIGESHCNPAAVNGQEKSGTFKKSSANGAGYGAGIAQWSNSWKQLIQKQFNRYTAIETWSLEDQIEIVIKHCKTTHKKFYSALKTATTIGMATDYALRGYENSGNDQGFMRTKKSMNAYTWAKTLWVPYIDMQTYDDGYTGLIVNRTANANIIAKAMGSTDVSDIAEIARMGAGGDPIDLMALAEAGALMGKIDYLNSLKKRYPSHTDYKTFTGSYSDLFSDSKSGDNALSISSFSNEANKKEQNKEKQCRIYSLNDATIVLDELSLPTDYKSDEFISSNIDNKNRKTLQSGYDTQIAQTLYGTEEQKKEPDENKSDDKKDSDEKSR